MNYNCPKKSKSFFIDQIAYSSEEKSESKHETTEKSDENKKISYYHIVLNKYRRILSSQFIYLSEEQSVIEVSKAEVMRTEISYLSAKLCLIRASLEVSFDKTNPLITGVIDSEEACIIERDNVSERVKVSQTPLNSQFQDIDEISTSMIDYAVISTYLFNKAVLSNDSRNGQVLLL
jgi:hypothetical protein